MPGMLPLVEEEKEVRDENKEGEEVPTMRANIVDMMLGKNRGAAFTLIQHAAKSRMKQEAIETIARGHGFQIPAVKAWYEWRLRKLRGRKS